MRNPHGFLQIIGDTPVPARDRHKRAIPLECDSMTCQHCGSVTFVRPKEKPEDLGGLCKVCMGLICASCVGLACKTLEQRLAEQEASYHARRSYGF